MISEKDEIVKNALEELLSIRIEGAIYNKDHLNYWYLLNENVVQSSTASIINGIAEFKRAMVASDKSRELLSYHLRVMTRLSNSEMVVAGANNLFETFISVAERYHSAETLFDIYKTDKMVEVDIYDRILMMYHICQDLLDANFLSHKLKYDEMNNKKPTPRRGFAL